jgi:glycosyltransferase involved in cell wall biosynthesis
MKPKVAFLPGGIDACALYRMFFAHLRTENSIFVFQVHSLEVDLLKDQNIVIVQRLSSQQNYEAIQLFKKMNLKIIYDLDDDLWSVPIFNPAYKIMKQWLPGFEICAKMADVITVSTEHLRVMVRNALGKHCPRVEVIENAVDFDWFRPVSEKYRKKRDGKVVLGWAGTDTHSGDVEKVFSLIPQLLRDYPELEFEVVGEKLPKELEEFGDRARQRYFVPIAEFAANWASWQWDIALAPVASNTFNLSKSNIKMIEAAAMKIPCVASCYGEYKKFANNSRILRVAAQAESLREWQFRIQDLVDNAEYRKLVGEEMYRVGLEKYNIVDRVGKWNELFSDVLS